MQHIPIFAFDFSMNKPAMACLIDNELSFHDLRTITKSNSRTLLFDVVVPYKFKYSNEEIKKMIEEKLGNECNYNLVIGFDYQFVSH